MTFDPRPVLEELYSLDPDLKQHEPALLALIEKLVAARPDVTADPRFVQELRARILEHADTLSAKPSFLTSLFSSFAMPKLSYAVTGAILGVLVAAPVTYYALTRGDTSPFPMSDSGQELFSYSVTPTSPAAFGDLRQVAPGGAGGRGGAETATNAARPQSGGGGDGVTMDSKLIAPGFPGEIIRYNYKLEGEIPALSGGTVSVLRRTPDATRIPFSSIARSFNIGAMDLGSFDNMTVDSISMTQPGQYGYMVSAYFRDGSLSVSQNWEAWPHPESACTTEACYRQYQTKIGDLLPDETLISIAQDFAADHGFELSRYGEPEVDNAWRVDYDRMTDKSIAYVPDVQRVIFPFLVEGKPVIDEGGNKTGISMGISVRHKRVTDAWGVMSNTFESSDYAAVSDPATVQSFIDSLDSYPMPLAMEGQQQPTVKNVTITLGAPTMAYSTFYTYSNNRSDTLLLPALVFPVTSVPQGEYFWRRAIVVPLAKDVIEQRLRDMQGQGTVSPAADGVLR